MTSAVIFQMVAESMFAFAVVALTATLSPGPAVLFTIQNALSAGSKPAFAGALGNAVGLMLVSGLAFAGVSVLLLQSPVAFTVLKVAGALYLLFLAWKQWQQAHVDWTPEVRAAIGQRWFGRGIAVALTNPKAWLFISALFPQFVDLRQPAAVQFAGLTLIFVLCSLVAHTFWLSVVRFGLGSQRRPALRRLLGRAQALLLAAVGLSLCWTPLSL